VLIEAFFLQHLLDNHLKHIVTGKETLNFFIIIIGKEGKRVRGRESKNIQKKENRGPSPF
jgi:hypothetical protein